MLPVKRFVTGTNRNQSTLFPEYLDDFVTGDNPVRVIEAFVAALDLRGLGFAGVEPCVTGRPAYHPAVRLKLYLYGYLNRIQSSRRLERETQRNGELRWLIERHGHRSPAQVRQEWLIATGREAA